MDVLKLREEYPRFVYQQYVIEKHEQHLNLRFHFEIPGLAAFHPTWTFPLHNEGISNIDDESLNNYAFNLGMVELISYWKAVCPPTIEIRCGSLEPEQAEFWKNLYLSGLGEFRYLNGITIADEDFLNFSQESLTAKTRPRFDHFQWQKNPKISCLIPVGGGKDSIVSLELLRSLAERRFAYSINATEAVKASCDLAAVPEQNRIFPQRRLDQTLLNLNAEGYLNGHTPFSAIVAFSAALAAYLYQIPDIVLSNEASADEATVKGSDVNHQYSKSSHFEFVFAHYLQKYLNPQQRYFSLLRPFSELAIARRFARYPQYFDVFRSCNVGSRTNSWCGHCGKCLFVATILLPFLGLEKVEEVIGHQIFDDAQLEESLFGLSGFTAEKPFECVGTVEELNLALVMAINRALDRETCTAPDFACLPLLLKNYAQAAYQATAGDLRWNPQTKRFDLRLHGMDPLKARNEAHAVPPEYQPYLADFLEA